MVILAVLLHFHRHVRLRGKGVEFLDDKIHGLVILVPATFQSKAEHSRRQVASVGAVKSQPPVAIGGRRWAVIVGVGQAAMDGDIAKEIIVLRGPWMEGWDTDVASS